MSSIVRRAGRKGVALKFIDAASGKVRFKQFPNVAAAEAFSRRQLREAKLSGSPEAHATLKEFALRWLGQVRHTLRKGTARGYASMLDNHILPALGDRQLRRLGRAEVKDFIAALLEQGLAKKTAANIRGVLHEVLEAAHEDMPEILTSNPATFRGRLKLTPTKAERRAKIKALSAEQLQAFLAAARETVPERYPILRFIAGTGLRAGEALGLQLDDVDAKRRQVLVRRSITEGREEPTKTGHERTIDLGPGLAEDVAAWLAIAKQEKLARPDGSASPRGPWMFSSERKPIRLRRLEDDFKLAAKAAGLPPWHTPHHLRHTFASLALQGGESIYYVQRQLGHATITMTIDLYGSWLPSGDQAAAARIEARSVGSNVTSVTSAPETVAQESTGTGRRTRKSLKLVHRSK